MSKKKQVGKGGVSSEMWFKWLLTLGNDLDGLWSHHKCLCKRKAEHTPLWSQHLGNDAEGSGAQGHPWLHGEFEANLGLCLTNQRPVRWLRWYACAQWKKNYKVGWGVRASEQYMWSMVLGSEIFTLWPQRGNSRSAQKQKDSWNKFFSGFFTGTVAQRHLGFWISGFRNCRRIHCCYFKPPSLSWLLCLLWRNTQWKQLREGRATLAHSSGVPFIEVGRRGAGAWGSCSQGIHVQEAMMPTTFRVALPTSVNLSRSPSQACAEAAFLRTLGHYTSTTGRNHHKVHSDWLQHPWYNPGEK